MSRFLIVYFATYGAMHAYLVRKAWTALPQLGRLRIVLPILAAVMVFAPIAVRLLDRWRGFRLAGGLGLVTFCWLIFVFWFCVLWLLADGWNLAVRAAALLAPAAKSATITPGRAWVAFSALTVAAFCWGLVEATRVKVRRLAFPAEHLPPDVPVLRIVQITDLHLGGQVGRKRLADVVDLVRQQRPDIVVATGDIVDSSFHNVAHLADVLADLKPRFGKYAVLGNHEFYAGVEGSVAFHEAGGFRVLRGQAAQPVAGLWIAGVDDPGRGGTRAAGHTDEQAVLPPVADRNFVILLKHRPTVSPESIGRFDLQLSGHTHGGQVLPFTLIIRWFYRYTTGLHDPGGRSRLYVSRGAGTWGPPIRVMAPPEIAVITLRRPAGQPATAHAAGG